jgi:hypothetical protein
MWCVGFGFNVFLPSKKWGAACLALLLLAASWAPFGIGSRAFAEELNAGVSVTDPFRNNPLVNPNDLVQIEKGDALDMKISTTIGAGLSTEGDEFFGKLTKDYAVNGKVVLQRGTLIHGSVAGMTDPKRMGRDGRIQMKFDYLITPDGREIPIEGGHTTGDSKGKEILKIAGRSAAYTLTGGVMGALVVLQYGGLAAVAASNGYALAGGAALGGVVGLSAAMLGKGEYAMLQPGAELKIKLADGITLPSLNVAAQGNTLDEKRLSGLEVKVLGLKVDKDPFGDLKEMTLSVDISNTTDFTFSTFDMALIDENDNISHPSPFGDTGLWFGKIGPNTRTKGNLSFNVDDPKSVHYLVFYKQYSRELVAKVLVNAVPVVELADSQAHKTASKKRKSQRQSKQTASAS